MSTSIEQRLWYSCAGVVAQLVGKGCGTVKRGCCTVGKGSGTFSRGCNTVGRGSVRLGLVVTVARGSGIVGEGSGTFGRGCDK